MTRSVLALDPGGSKCDAVLVAEDGRVIGWGRFQRPGISGRSRTAIEAAVLEAATQIQGKAEIHLVGLSQTPLHPEAFAAHFSRQGHRILHRAVRVTEYDSALMLAGHDCGVVALAGTGAFAHGRTRDGRECHLDGLGPVLGDEGSAYDIGYRALRAAAKAGQRARCATSIRTRILREIQAAFPGKDLISFSLTPMDRSVIASFARLVDEEAEGGDAVAREILQGAAHSLAETVRDVIEMLGMAKERYVMVGTGGVIAGSRLYWEFLSRRVAEFAPNLESRRYPWPPVLGTALAGLAHLRGLSGEALHPLATVVRCSFEAYRSCAMRGETSGPPGGTASAADGDTCAAGRGS